MTEKTSTRYFQLTPDILLEYIYTDIDIANNQKGDVSEQIIDLSGDDKQDSSLIMFNNYTKDYNLCFNNNKDGFVLPVNMSESRFIQCVNDGELITLIDFKQSPIDEYTDNNDDIIVDNFKIHFTSKNYLGDYDGFILRASIYDEGKNKINLFSHIIKKTDDVAINPDPILINQKLYTTYIDGFKIPSTDALLNEYSLEGEKKLKTLLAPNYNLMNNSPVTFSIYGIKSTFLYGLYECYNTEKINTIYIPAKDDFNKLSVEIHEAEDGDYFEIYPEVDGGNVSFSDYIYRLSEGRPESYMILHEITLNEYYVDYYNNVQSEITHKEHYIVNAAQVDDVLEVNEADLDRVMLYRPIVVNSKNIVKFEIEDQMKIINTFDNTTIVKTGQITYGGDDGKNPKKYGKNLNKIYLGAIPAKINVYNKRPEEQDYVKITNSSSNVTIENHQHSVIGFIECVNVGVTIEQIPISSIEG